MNKELSEVELLRERKEGEGSGKTRTAHAFIRCFQLEIVIPICVCSTVWFCGNPIASRLDSEVYSLNWYNYSNCTKLFPMDDGPVS